MGLRMRQSMKEKAERRKVMDAAESTI